VAKNGNIYNIWTLDLKSGQLKQYTDCLGANVSPVMLNDGKTSKIAFVSYYKGDYTLHELERKEPLLAANTSDFGAPGPVIDFQAPLTHTMVAENKRKKSTFEKMFLEGRPPINVGVTSGGQFFGGTAISFGDVLGDKRFDVMVASVSQYKTLSVSYMNLARRFQYAIQGFSQTQFFYGNNVLYDPVYSGFIDRSLATATQTVRGGTLFGIYPLDRYRRLELTGGMVQFNQSFNDPSVAALAQSYQQQVYGRQLLQNGTVVPFGAAFIQETTVFREYGPLAGNTMRLSYEIAPKIANSLSRQTADVDARYYLRLLGNGVLAFRGRGYKSWGNFPNYTYFGGNSEMRGYDYLEFLGQNAFFGDAELRFPLIEAMLTPLGVMGGVRGVFFFNVGAAWFADAPFTFASSKPQTVTPIATVNVDPITGAATAVYGAPQTFTGFRLVDGRASYGVGLETFLLGFPIHFDWSWRTLFNKPWESYVQANTSYFTGAFRKARFSVWIGYDF
jgi:hypothetical protein